MSQDASTSPAPAVGSILQALNEVRAECEEWERDVEQLFEEIEEFVRSANDTEGEARAIVAGESAAPPDQELSGLKNLVEQQTDVLKALVTALTSSPDQLGSESAAKVAAAVGKA